MNTYSYLVNLTIDDEPPSADEVRDAVAFMFGDATVEAEQPHDALAGLVEQLRLTWTRAQVESFVAAVLDGEA